MSVKWRVDAGAMCIEGIEPGRTEGYQICLEECTTAAGVLDWLTQLSKKPWMTDEDVGRLVRDLDFLIRFQENLCGGGSAHPPLPSDRISKRARELDGRFLEDIRSE